MYIQFDAYDNGTHGEDGPLTKDQLIDAICPDCGKAECVCVTFQDGSTAHVDENGILKDITKKVAAFGAVMFLLGSLIGGAVIAHFDQKIVDSYSVGK